MRQINIRDITRKFKSIGDSEDDISWDEAYEIFSLIMINLAFDFEEGFYDRTPNL